VKIYFDGSSTPNDSKVINYARYAIYVVHGDGCPDVHWTRAIGNKTNNEAEYEGLKAAYEFAAYYRNEDITIYTDSKLVYGQVMKGWKCQDKFQRYLAVVRVLLPVAKLEWIPREENLAGKLLEK
jgi:ribonuclease HI